MTDANATPVAVPGQVHPRLIGYTPTCVGPADWERLGPSARALITKAEPASDEEAKGMAGALCRLLADQLADHPDATLEQMLTEAAITRLVNRLRASGAVTVATTQMLRARLNRLLATVLALPEPAGCRHPRRAQVDPGQVWARIDRVDAAPPPVALVLRRRVALGAAAGLIGIAADRAGIHGTGHSVVVHADDGSAPLVAPRYRHLLTTVSPDPHPDRLAWQRARDWWFARYGGWDDDQLRDAWAAQVITLAVPAADLFTAERIAYRAIDRIDPGPGGLLTAAHRALLRG